MKKILKNMMRYTAAGVLCAVCAVSLIAMLAYYQEKEALVPAIIAMGSFVGAQMLLDNAKMKKTA